MIEMNFKFRWIAVKEKLPEKIIIVLCYDATNESFYTAQYTKIGQWVDENYEVIKLENYEKITHWAYLPTVEEMMIVENDYYEDKKS